MSKTIKNSIDQFVNELQARIDLFKSSLVSSDIVSNRESIESIRKIVQVYTETPLEDLKVSDIYSLSLTDIKKILKLIGRNNEYIEELMNNQDSDIYENVYKMIVDYVQKFYSMQKNQSEVISNNIQEYEKIIDLLSNNNSDIIIDDINGLMNSMTSVNLDDSAKADILVYVANKNAANYIEELNNDVEKLVMNIIPKILPSEDSKEYKVVEESILDDAINIDILPSIALEIEYKTSLTYKDAYNALVGYIINRQYNNFYTTESISEKLKIKDYITTLIQSVIDIEKEIIQESEEMIEEYLDDFDNLVQSGYQNFQEYETSTIEKLTSKYGSFDLAIDLKKSVIIHHMIENVKVAKKYYGKEMDEETEIEFYITLDKLSELKYIMDSYIEIENNKLQKVKE